MRPPIAPALVRRSALALAGAAAAVALAAPAPASAAESAMPTAQAKAYGMDWVPYIDPADLPPVEQRKVICLVDSGVEVNPDLPADRPEGPIVMRTSVDNTSGLPGDKPEHAHGTSMASMAGALAGNERELPVGTTERRRRVRRLRVRTTRGIAVEEAAPREERGVVER